MALSAFAGLKTLSKPSTQHPTTFPTVKTRSNCPSRCSLINSRRIGEVSEGIKSSMSNCLSETNLHLTVPGLKVPNRRQELQVGHVYDGRDYVVLVTTDRQSAFDRILASITLKGQVLSITSLWGLFDRTKRITSNAVVASPDKNGLLKNQRLPENIWTPTTKAADHDVPVTPEEIVEGGLMTLHDYGEVSTKALRLFEYGQLDREAWVLEKCNDLAKILISSLQQA